MSDELRPLSRVARGATYMLVQGIVSSLIGIVYFVILARWFPPPGPEMGVYAILTFIVALAQVFGSLALPSAAVKYIAQYLAEGHPEKAKSVVARILQVSLLTSIPLCAFLFVCATWFSSWLLGTLIWAPLFQGIAVTSFFSILYVQIGSFLQGLQKMRELAAVSVANMVVDKLVAIYLLYVGWGLFSVVCGWIAGLFVSSIAGLILTARHLGILEKPHPMRTLINFSYPLYFSNILIFGVDWVDQLFILPYMGVVYLGMYGTVAVRAATVPGLISTSIVIALFPKLSELYSQHGVESVREAFRVSTRYAVFVSFPVITVLAIMADPVIVILAGVEWREAAWPLTILCLTAFLGALGVAIRPTFLTLERTKTASMIAVTSILSNTTLSYITLAHLSLGMTGAAFSRVVASIVSVGLSLYFLRGITKVTFDKEALWKAATASVIMAITILTSRVFGGLIYELYFLHIYVILGSVVYFLSLIGLKAIKKQDMELVQDYLPGGLKRVAVWLSRLAFVE